MQLALDAITKRVGNEVWLSEMSLALQPGRITVLLGATQAGKTTLMRIMAGLDVPSSGHVFVDNQDVTGWSVRRRNVAMRSEERRVGKECRAGWWRCHGK